MNKSVIFLMIGRIRWDKGYKEFRDAAKFIISKYPYTEFQLLGYFDGQPEMVNKEIVLNDIKNKYFNFLGFHEDTTSIMCKADCIVLPSYHEGLSRVLMEALAVGKPIITTDIPGCKETVDNNENGFLVKVQDSESLINAMETFLLLSQEQRTEMGKKSRLKAVNEFDVKFVINKYRDLINELSKP